MKVVVQTIDLVIGFVPFLRDSTIINDRRRTSLSLYPNRKDFSPRLCLIMFLVNIDLEGSKRDSDLHSRLSDSKKRRLVVLLFEL